MDTGFENLVVVAGVAALAPLIIGLAPWLRVPSVVLEIAAGVVLGPAVLGVVEVDVPLEVLSVIGLAFLLFSVGLELDVRTLGAGVLPVAALGYLVSLLLGIGFGVGSAALGWGESALLVGICLSATALGLVVPILEDAAELESGFGTVVLASATFSDVGAILLLTLFFAGSSTSVGVQAVLASAFVGVVALTAAALLLAERRGPLTRAVGRLRNTTAEIRIRGAVVLLVGFVALAERLGLEAILGALMAGIVVNAVDRDPSTHPDFRLKLDAIGYGFLIPIFFVATGASLDVGGLLEDRGVLARVPVLVIALLVVRGVPTVLYLSRLTHRETAAAALLEATSLPFLVAGTMIGVETGALSEVDAAALVAAGVVSVVLFPALALGLLRGRKPHELPAQLIGP